MKEEGDTRDRIYEFGNFVLYPRERILLAADTPVHLTDKVFDTLLLLIENNGRLLSKEEMIAALWNESFVEEGNLAKNISRLRKILNTDGGSLIETLPKRGYRFRADVKEFNGDTRLLVHRHLRVKVLQSLQNDDEQQTFTSAPSLDQVRSIAILPFQPLDPNLSDDVFGLGISDALITQLNRAGKMQVRPTSAILKYNVREQDPCSIGRELQVDAVLEGRFQRSEDKFRLSVQMLQTATGRSLWADVFDTNFEHIFAVQDKIADSIVGGFTKRLGSESLASAPKRDTENVEAYKEFIKGRYYWTKRTTEGFDKALRCFQKAIDIDPLYALAYAGIAGIYNIFPLIDGYDPRDYFPKAKAAALQALEIDENLAEAHTAFGLAILHCDWNWSGAEVSFLHAIKLNPNFSGVHELLGTFLCRVGRIGEAIIALKKAQEIDPLSPINATWLAEVFRYHGEIDASVRIHQDTLRSFPDFYLAHYHLAFSYIDLGRLDDAEVHSERAVRLSGENSLTLSLQGILQIALGNNERVHQTLNRLLELRAEKYISGANIASVYAAAGDNEKAIEWLETAFTENDPYLTWMTFDREFESLRHDARFQVLLQKVGLAETSR